MNRKCETNELKDTFASLSDKEILKLKKQSQADCIDENDLLNIAEEISERIGRRIQLPSSYLPDTVYDTFSKNLDAPLFYAEIVERLEKKSRTPLVHQHKRGDVLYTSLYKWHKFTEIIEPFINPVQYCMSNTQKRQTVRSTTSTLTHSPLILSNKDLHIAVQDKLVDSHYEPLSTLTPELVEPIERVLDATLMKVIILRDMAFMCFEWDDPMPFVFVMAFMLSFTESGAEKVARHTVVTLHRKDIMAVDDDEEAVITDINKKKKNPLKAVVNPLLDMDEDEDIYATKQPLQYMNSENIEQEHALRSFIACVKESSVSYLTCAYIKRD